MTVLNLHHKSPAEIQNGLKEVVDGDSIIEINIYRSRLPSFPQEISKFKKLECISAFDSEIEEVPLWMYDLIYLRTLNISKNLCRRLNSRISQLKVLSHLDLSNNNIRTLPFPVIELTNLCTILLKGNPAISKNVWSRSTTQVTA